MDEAGMYPFWPATLGAWTVVVIVACVALTVLFIALTMRLGRPWLDLPDRPKQVLDERLARGDIDLEEYDKLRALIG